ncbi:hypothetical protein A2311_01830 [candidate division WOR-1 bacterium RIFOXYB2_FULL_48_7]|uniref:PASTA domain-containing protein n=1 Tax=candidate division WOR-1 bacterium RIFOXYB2_FULL_48_7 TaxID=1802583 RepID=A0A1F4TF81_UNCSA|nr:MAG: hypothetical protein A2311_01830 [candidate division WOR-1 bacterium RIFOXYB2_FULL_48_7]
MITNYLIIYFAFIIVASILVSLLVLRLRLPSPRIITGFIILFIISPLLVGYLYLIYFDSLPEVEVPAVTGMIYELAEQKLADIDLQARNTGSVYDRKHPEGTVISQRPEPGRIVKAGRTINLVVSSGKRKIIAPNLLGRNVTQAIALLEAEGIALGETRYERNPGVMEGTVLAQEPLPGEQVEVAGSVDLLVSTTLEVVIEEKETN